MCLRFCLIIIIFLLSIGSYSQNLFTNPSFETRTCCPSNFSQFSCVSNWKQAVSCGGGFCPDGSCDYFNTCGYTGGGSPSPPPSPYPNGNACVGGFNGIEPFAQCLSSTLPSGSTYTITYRVASSTTGNERLYVYGVATCPSFPLPGVMGISTPASFILMDSSAVINTNNSSWSSGTVTFTTPTSIAAIVLINKGSGGYWYMDNLSMLAACPSAPTGSGGNSSVCGSNAFTFPARTCATGTLRWYENNTPSGSFYTGASVVPTATTTYYPFCFSTCLSPAGNPATATYTCPISGSGSTWIWTGCTSTDWFNPCNWNRGSVPNTTSNVIIPFTANQPTISSGTANCYDINIQSSSGAIVTLNSTGGGVLNVTKP